MTISQANVSGTGFSISGLAVPTTIAAGGSTTFNVAFSPTSTSSVSGSVSLVNNGPSSPLAISLTWHRTRLNSIAGSQPDQFEFRQRACRERQHFERDADQQWKFQCHDFECRASDGIQRYGSSCGYNTRTQPNRDTERDVRSENCRKRSGSVSVSSNATNSPTTVVLAGTGMVQAGPDLAPPICGLTNDATSHVPSTSGWAELHAAPGWRDLYGRTVWMPCDAAYQCERGIQEGLVKFSTMR